MARVAFYTFGILQEAFGHPCVQGFVDMASLVFDAAEKSEGFINRYRSLDAVDSINWGEEVYPDINRGGGGKMPISTLSLWRDLESVFAFAYHGIHAEALRSGRDWITETGRPSYVVWWVDDSVIPTHTDAVQRLEFLHDHGSSAHAFNFKQPYGPDNSESKIDRTRVKSIMNNTQATSVMNTSL